MNSEQFEQLHKQQRLKAVNFIEAGCGPMVIEIEYDDQGQLNKELIKDDAGEVITCRNVKQGYDICLRAGVHEANLVQLETHDEAAYSEFADYHKDSIPLKF